MKNKRQIIIVLVIITAIAILCAFIINILFKINSSGVFKAEWEAGDALNYAAAIFGAIGTIILGFIANSQNERLCELEKNNYIANYSSMILINSVKINPVASIPVNYENHYEQLLLDTKIEKASYANTGYSFEIEAIKVGEAYPALIHIEECMFYINNENNEKIKVYLDGKNWCDNYSRVAISGDKKIYFGMTYVLEKSKREIFEDAIKNLNYNIICEIVYKVVTEKNVCTLGKCCSKLIAYGTYGNLHWEADKPKIFFYGNEIINDNSINYAGEEIKHG